jgi:hypothetical protein
VSLTFHYARGLAEAAHETPGPTIRNSNAMERFYRRYRWMFSAQEKSWVEASVSVSSWDRVAYEVRQEQREMRGFSSDPKRLGKHPSASGLGIRALMMPHYFLNKAFAAKQGQNRRRR